MSPDSKQGRTIVVTGGAHGIGRAAVLLCAARGDKIAVLDKNAEAAEAAAAEAVKRGAKSALGLLCDVGSEEQVEKAFELVCNKMGAPYGLFTSASSRDVAPSSRNQFEWYVLRLQARDPKNAASRSTGFDCVRIFADRLRGAGCRRYGCI